MPTFGLIVGIVLLQADTLTLDQVLTRAFATRPQVAVAGGIVAAARGSSRVLGIVPNPGLQLDAYDAAPEHKIYLTQPVGWLFTRGADRTTGRALIERARADSAQMMAEIGRQVRYGFVHALARRRELALAEEQRRLADSLLGIAERRLSLGDASALERDHVAQEAARARLAVSLARETARMADVALARAIGSAGVQVRGDLADGLASVGPDQDANGSVPPLLAAALADSAAAAARLRSARLAQIPPVSLRAGQEWGGDDIVTKAFLGVSISLPIFSRGRETVAEAAGNSAVAGGLAAEARLQLAAETESVRVRLEESARRARLALDSLVPNAGRIRAGAFRVYQLGQTGVLPTFDALRVERDVVRAMIDALVAFQEARADWLALFGRIR